MKKFALILLLLSAVSVAFYGCKKEDDPEPKTKQPDAQAAEDQALADRLFNDLKNISDEASSGEINTLKSGSGSIGSCANVLLDTNTTPHTIKIDFGAKNCLCNDGRSRRGVINVSFTGRYKDSGTVITISTTNFFVDNHGVEGTKTIANKGRNAKGNLNYDVSVKGKITKAANGRTIDWESTRNNEWAEGEKTWFYWLDDVYLISGSGKGTNSNGVSWKAEITKPLRIQIGCRWITAGTLDLDVSGQDTWTADYGNGNCDNKATITVNGKVYDVQMD